MSATSIEWTDKTWNPVTGCTKVSPGCKNCYAEGVAERFWAKQYPPVLFSGSKKGGPVYRPREFTDVQTHTDRLDQPLRWKKPMRIFVNSMSDLFHEGVPRDFIVRVWAVMQASPHHTFQVLTKRAERMHEILTDPKFEPDVEEATEQLACERGWCHAHGDRPFPLSNVWLGVSVENKPTFRDRVPLLLKTPAAVRWISAEPLLDDIVDENFTICLVSGFTEPPHDDKIDWVVVGGESGVNARPCNVDHVTRVVEACLQWKTPVFVKQLGSVPMITEEEWRAVDPTRKPLLSARNAHRVPPGFVPIKLYDRKGGDITEFPFDLRKRQFPIARTA